MDGIHWICIKKGLHVINILSSYFALEAQSSVMPPNLVARQGNSFWIDPSSMGHGMRFESKLMYISQTRVHACTLSKNYHTSMWVGQLKWCKDWNEFEEPNQQGMRTSISWDINWASNSMMKSKVTSNGAFKSSYIDITTYKLANHFSH